MFNIRRVIVKSLNLSRILFGSLLLLTSPIVVVGADIAEKPERPNVKIAYSASSAAFTPLYVAFAHRPFCEVWFGTHSTADSVSDSH